MIKLPKFSEHEIAQLNHLRYHHSIPSIRKKVSILYFKATGYSHKEIEGLAGISSTTLTKTLKLYLNGGLEKIIHYECKPRRRSELDQHVDLILNELNKENPATIKEAAYKIFQLTGVKRSRFRISKFLKKHGFKPLKTGSLPARADFLKQAEFKKKS